MGLADEVTRDYNNFIKKYNEASMKLELKNKWESRAEAYSYSAVDGLQNSNWSPGAVREAIYAAYLSGALKATEECSRIMKK